MDTASVKHVRKGNIDVALFFYSGNMALHNVLVINMICEVSSLSHTSAIQTSQGGFRSQRGG